MGSPGSAIPFRLRTVRVGTLNRPKLEAVERALEAYTETPVISFSQIDVEGFCSEIEKLV